MKMSNNSPTGSFRFMNAVLSRPVLLLALWAVGCAKGYTQTTEAERNCLARFASGKKKLAEIGVYYGVTTCRLRTAMDPSGELFAVDPYPRQRLGFSSHRVIATTEVSRIHIGKVNWVRATGEEAARQLDSENSRDFDFVFIDGDHSYEGLKADWEGWSKLIAPGGIVALHDSRPTPNQPESDLGSIRFTREVVERDSRFQVVECVDSLTVLQKSN
jgi:predicted O-methyltransferase YrrM